MTAQIKIKTIVALLHLLKLFFHHETLQNKLFNFNY